MEASLKELPNKKSFHFLFWGAVNTGFGYCASVGLYYLLTPYLSLLPIMLLVNVVCITFSFTTYRFFVFKSTGIWWKEYLRSYVVYGGSAIIGIIGMLLLVDQFKIPFWLAQGLLIIVSVLFSYFGHDRFTFKRSTK